MLDFLRDEPQNVVVAGDAFVASETLENAIPKSPFLLMREVDKIIMLGLSDRIVNCAQIQLN